MTHIERPASQSVVGHIVELVTDLARLSIAFGTSALEIAERTMRYRLHPLHFRSFLILLIIYFKL